MKQQRDELGNALRRECPDCGARPGVRCRTFSGGVLWKGHALRHRLALEEELREVDAGAVAADLEETDLAALRRIETAGEMRIAFVGAAGRYQCGRKPIRRATVERLLRLRLVAAGGRSRWTMTGLGRRLLRTVAEVGR